MGQVEKLTTAERAKGRRLQETFNQTLEEHNAKRKEQLNACYICRRPFSQYQAYQDHDHACCPRRKKKFCGLCNRGLLCFLCNKKAVAAVEYMRKVGIDPEKVVQYVNHWTVVIKSKGGYVPEQKTKRVSKKQASLRLRDRPPTKGGSTVDVSVRSSEPGKSGERRKPKSSKAKSSRVLG